MRKIYCNSWGGYELYNNNYYIYNLMGSNKFKRNKVSKLLFLKGIKLKPYDLIEIDEETYKLIYGILYESIK